MQLSDSGKWGDQPVEGEKNADRWEAPPLWIKRTFGAAEQEVSSAIIDALKRGGVENPEIICLHITLNPDRDHAYILLNSAATSELLIDGTITVVVTNRRRKDDVEEDCVLCFDKADHLTPNDGQDPYTLYIWQLPKNKTVEMVHEALTKLLTPFAPVIEIEVSDRAGKCDGWAKIKFDYEFDVQKCIYLLNYNVFMGSEIRAAFFNFNRGAPPPVSKAQGAKGTEKTRYTNPRPKANKSGSGKLPKVKKDSAQLDVGKTLDMNWNIVGREGRRRKP